MRLPDFLVVGAAKSGTTSLWQYLGQHPSVFMTQDIRFKELGYFCFHYGIKDLSKYLSFFEGAKQTQLIGESCHAYLSSPESAQLIFDSNPKTKIIIIIRNPMQRAFSLYNWMVVEGYESAETFEVALELENERIKNEDFKKKNPHGFYQNYNYFHSGLYYQQIKRYLDIFGKQQCIIHTFDEFKKNAISITQKTYSFLGVDEKFIPATEIHNEGKVPYSAKWHNKLNKLTKRKYVGDWYNKSIAASADVLMKLNLRTSKGVRIKQETYQKLKNKYEEDIKATAALIEKDLGNWLE